MFYVAEWYKETVADMVAARERYNALVAEHGAETGGAQTGAGARDLKKEERKLGKLLAKGEQMKSFVLRLVNKKHLKKRTQLLS